MQSVQNVDIELVLQARGPAHIEQVMTALREAGFQTRIQA
jgi:hypothetical protein